MKRSVVGFMVASAVVLGAIEAGLADEVERSESGKYYDADGNPTYNVGEDGVVDWFTYSGFRRYHSECHVCHGPDAMGSTFAPPLADSLKTMSYEDFVEVVVNGQENIGAADQNKMPGFGLNRNVMCFIDDLYVYLRARADGAVPRGRPSKKEAKSEETRADELSCMEG